MERLSKCYLPMSIAGQGSPPRTSPLLMIGKGLVWEMLRGFIFGIQSQALIPIGPQDWFIPRNIKKQCPGFKLVINLLPRVIIFICLLLFPPGSKEVLYLRDNSLLRGHQGLWKKFHFISPPPIYNHGGSWVLSGVINDFPKFNLCSPGVHFSKPRTENRGPRGSICLWFDICCTVSLFNSSF